MSTYKARVRRAAGERAVPYIAPPPIQQWLCGDTVGELHGLAAEGDPGPRAAGGRRRRRSDVRLGAVLDRRAGRRGRLVAGHSPGGRQRRADGDQPLAAGDRDAQPQHAVGRPRRRERRAGGPGPLPAHRLRVVLAGVHDLERRPGPQVRLRHRLGAAVAVRRRRGRRHPGRPEGALAVADADDRRHPLRPPPPVQGRHRGERPRHPQVVGVPAVDRGDGQGGLRPQGHHAELGVRARLGAGGAAAARSGLCRVLAAALPHPELEQVAAPDVLVPDLRAGGRGHLHPEAGPASADALRRPVRLPVPEHPLPWR